MRNKMKRLTLIICVAALTGCALSPQQVSLHVSQPVPMEKVMIQPIALTVMDKRQSDAIGSRGGIYPDTALIELENDVASLIEFSLAQSLTKAGVKLTKDEPNSRKMNVSVDAINYKIIKQPWFKKTARVAMKTTIELIDGNETLTREFNSMQEWTRLGYPSQEDNQKYVLEVFNSLLEQMIQDNELNVALRKPAKHIVAPAQNKPIAVPQNP